MYILLVRKNVRRDGRREKKSLSEKTNFYKNKENAKKKKN